MITTRDIKVDLSRGKRPLQQTTTKKIDVYVKPGPLKPTKIAVTTHNIEDVADIAEKKRRDNIAKQKKARAISKKQADEERMAKARAAKEAKKK